MKVDIIITIVCLVGDVQETSNVKTKALIQHTRFVVSVRE